ncbi:class I glutamine amidotransferase-like protein [Amylostereum chailletii]|nr:class I glutamine amidotransferase-like protein [Amylostereum chailletii]
MYASGCPLHVITVGADMIYSQICCFTGRGVELKVMPWDYDFSPASEEPFDGLFLSSDHGDPTTIQVSIGHVRGAMHKAERPILCVCLGHQLMALAASVQTSKMKYRNLSYTTTCTDTVGRRCYTTSQNHDFQVGTTTSNKLEGVFYPGSTPGPRDTKFLFDVFVKNIIEDCVSTDTLAPTSLPGGEKEDNENSLSTGQAGEFNYAGSQAIKALKEEGIIPSL